MNHQKKQPENRLLSCIQSCVSIMVIATLYLVIPDICRAQSITYESVSYHGIVKDKESGTPLEGVIVEALHQYEFDTTNAKGEYNLSFYAATSNTSHLPVRTTIEPLYSVRNGRLHLNLSRQSAIAISLYTLAGRRIFSETGSKEAGQHAIDLRLSAKGIYVCALVINRERSVFRLNTSVPMSLNPSAAGLSTGTTTAKLLASAAVVMDTLYFFKPGYHPRYVPVPRDTRQLPDVLLTPVNLKNGVPRGVKVLCSRKGTTMSIYVNSRGTSVDSIVATVNLYCNAGFTEEKYTFGVTGSFDIPANGVVTIGDTVQVCFTDTSATGSFLTRQIFEKSTSIKCTWTEQTLFGGGGYQIKMMEHTNHRFELGAPVMFFNTWYTLATTADHGAITRSPDQENFLPGEVVKLTGVPDSGYGIRTWSDADSLASEVVAIVTMYSNRTVTATFGVYNMLTTPKNSTGSISRLPYRDSYVPGDTVRLIASPENKYYFISWKGDFCRTSGDTAWVVMDSSKTVSADFGILADLSITNRHGKIDNEPPYFYYKPEDSVMVRIIAQPDSGFQFLRWDGDLFRISGDTAWVCMSQKRDVEAVFISNRAIVSYVSGVETVPYTVELSPDGSIAAVGVRDNARLVDTHTGALIAPIGANETIVYDLCFSSDGAKLLLSSWNGYTEVWDVASRTLDTTLKDPSCGRSAIFSSDNSLIVTGDNDNIGIWSAADGKKIDSITGVKTWAEELAISPDNKWVAVASQFDSTIIYSTVTHSIFARTDAQAVGFKFSSASDTLMVITKSATLIYMDLSTGRTTKKSVVQNRYPTCASFSYDGQMVACGTWSSGFYVVNTQTGNIVLDLPYHTPIGCIAFSKDNKSFITGDTDGLFIVWKVD